MNRYVKITVDCIKSYPVDTITDMYFIILNKKLKLNFKDCNCYTDLRTFQDRIDSSTVEKY